RLLELAGTERAQERAAPDLDAERRGLADREADLRRALPAQVEPRAADPQGPDLRRGAIDGDRARAGRQLVARGVLAGDAPAVRRGDRVAALTAHAVPGRPDRGALAGVREQHGRAGEDLERPLRRLREA